MKKTNKILLTILLPLIMFFGCRERTDLTGPQPQSGQVNFTRFVAIGNSLFSGFESNALFKSAQMYSIGNLISQQVNTPFAQPLISDPGIGGQIKIVTLNPFVTTRESVQGGQPENLDYPGPYNNLGIPGIVLADVLTATSTEQSYSHSAFLDIILRGLGTPLAQAMSLNPTMVILWIGNNDVLGFAASGGMNPATPTDVTTFSNLFGSLTNALASTGAKVAVANIPNVTSIPFFTTVGPQFAQNLIANGVPGFWYQNHTFTPTPGSPAQLTNYSMLLTLVSQSYLADLGVPTGRFYRDFGIPPSYFGVDTTKPFGVDQGNPIPNALILDASEIQMAEDATSAFNYTISTEANKYPNQFVVVDINGLLKKIRAADASGGMEFGGIKFSTEFVTGGIFSLDGIHPTAQGNAIIANEFLKAINGKFKAGYKMVNIGTTPGTISFANGGSVNLFSSGAFLDPFAYRDVRY